MKKPELLLPAGTLTRLKIALLYGADAVYVGLPSFSLRSTVGLSLEELIEGSRLIHEKGKKLYIAVNLFSRNEDIAKLPLISEMLPKVSPDGIIVSDPGIFDYLHEKHSDIPLHISTQANVGSWLTVKSWEKRGATLCVLSRETTFNEIKEIRANCPGIGLEIFIHGSMCMSYSGRCLISAYLTGRSANQGKCTNSCRWKYKLKLEEEKRPGEFFTVEEDGRGSYIMNSKDLCLLPRLPEILPAKINSLKIEGRNKSDYYVAQTARVYRMAIDDWFESPDSWDASLYLKELALVHHRPYTEAFFDAIPGAEAQQYDTSESAGIGHNAGIVTKISDGEIHFEVRCKLTKGTRLEFLLPGEMKTVNILLDTICDAKTRQPLTEISPGTPGQAIVIPLTAYPENQRQNIQPYLVARKMKQVESAS